MHDDDKEILEEILDGNISKYEVIIHKYQARIISLCFRYTKSYPDAEEVAQESFLKAFNSLHKFRFESKFYSWLHRISINCSLNYINSKEKTKEKETISENSGLNEGRREISSETPYNAYNMQIMAETIESVYNSLPDDLKLMIKLRDIDDLSYDEMTKIAKLPIGTIKSKLHRAREILTKALGKYIDDE
ncbi:MAG: sigma-70 family RNA polymerase sigma factor [Gammaproteobacteria bacterium]|jgi:RNA polymerase sigma-70 factor, ECF subfamily|nr:sigma-70 family RNA polymerase sigma factor [Gammaproteobacteria bacterium]MBT4462167.1 sigma-70 family RNA polymerase sigma factor [Gammaproteobacteria bacterium]MBT4655026.1 sigma-70 family RNA polymerase sigma factor [Gammaproteobacteria bacterium]MBT5116460.1 sigma-70 family RNA polymerase sigma factor [Gammaproteobacteria bacterium]MBT5761138.1 sigma-70 family RNA polymerase sigma factor [Gammaproteobacteria bacterium]